MQAVATTIQKEFKILKPREEWSFRDAGRSQTTAFTHDYHRYPAKFIPQIVRKLIGTRKEVQGYLETLQNVFDSFQSLPLRESMILSLRNQLLKYTTKDDTHRGEYKKKENTVGVLGPDGKVV